MPYTIVSDFTVGAPKNLSFLYYAAFAGSRFVFFWRACLFAADATLHAKSNALLRVGTYVQEEALLLKKAKKQKIRKQKQKKRPAHRPPRLTLLTTYWSTLRIRTYVSSCLRTAAWILYRLCPESVFFFSLRYTYHIVKFAMHPHH